MIGEVREDEPELADVRYASSRSTSSKQWGAGASRQRYLDGFQGIGTGPTLRRLSPKRQPVRAVAR
jgi:hypothetical protein